MSAKKAADEAPKVEAQAPDPAPEAEAPKAVDHAAGRVVHTAGARGPVVD